MLPVIGSDAKTSEFHALERAAPIFIFQEALFRANQNHLSAERFQLRVAMVRNKRRRRNDHRCTSSIAMRDHSQRRSGL
jgi:hypothetical protein